MTIFLILILVLSIVIIPLTLSIFSSQNDKNKQKALTPIVKPRSQKELMEILYEIIQQEWEYRYRFHFKLKNLSVVKYEYETEILVKNVMKSISPNLMEELKYYYTEEAIIRMVERISLYLLIEYTKKVKNEGI